MERPTRMTWRRKDSAKMCRALAGSWVTTWTVLKSSQGLPQSKAARVQRGLISQQLLWPASSAEVFGYKTLSTSPWLRQCSHSLWPTQHTALKVGLILKWSSNIGSRAFPFNQSPLILYNATLDELLFWAGYNYKAFTGHNNLSLNLLFWKMGSIMAFDGRNDCLNGLYLSLMRRCSRVPNLSILKLQLRVCSMYIHNSTFSHNLG